MAGHRKLGRPTDQRMAILRNQVTALLDNGSLKTTLARAKEVRKIAEKLITLAARECENSVTIKKDIKNEKGQVEQIEGKRAREATSLIRAIEAMSDG